MAEDVDGEDITAAVVLVTSAVVETGTSVLAA
jgi:hypothetical protein